MFEAMMFAAYRASIISAQRLTVVRSMRGVELHLRGSGKDAIRTMLLST